MCLYVRAEKKPELQPAEKDITVWKVLNRSKGGGLATPFQGYPVTDKTMKAFDHCHPAPDCPSYWRIGEGVIHSYANKKDAEWTANRLAEMCGDDSIVVEATIPVGTPYICGEDGGHDLCYGSTQLILKDIV